MGPRYRFQGMNSASLCSLAGRYDNPLPPRLLAPIVSLKIPALDYWSGSGRNIYGSGTQALQYMKTQGYDLLWYDPTCFWGRTLLPFHFDFECASSFTTAVSGVLWVACGLWSVLTEKKCQTDFKCQKLKWQNSWKIQVFRTSLLLLDIFSIQR